MGVGLLQTEAFLLHPKPHVEKGTKSPNPFVTIPTILSFRERCVQASKKPQFPQPPEESKFFLTIFSLRDKI